MTTNKTIKEPTMKKKAPIPTNSAIPNIVNPHSSKQASPRPASHVTSMDGANASTALAAETSTKSKKKKKKKKNKHKTHLSPTTSSMDAQQQTGITVPDTAISGTHHQHQGTTILSSSESSQQHAHVPPLHPPPALPGSLSYAYHQTSSTSLNSVTNTRQQSSPHNDNSTTPSIKKNADKDAIWSSSMNNAEERQKIREFWLQLGEDERRSLVKVEKEAVLRKMKEQQKHSCNCSVCGKKRTAIEDELEVLYDAYYEELEQYANHQQHYARQTLHGFQSHYGLEGSSYGNCINDQGDDDIHSLDDGGDEEYDDPLEQHTFEGDHGSELSDDDFSDSYEDDLKHFAANRMATKANIRSGDHFSFGNSLTVKGGILTVADDLLKNDGKKFLDMMERLAERRMQRDDEVHLGPDIDYYDEEDDDDDLYEGENEEDTRTEEQRMEEGRRMFQVFAARMFEQRVLAAYREKVAKERQQRLLQELEEEDQQRQNRELKKQRDKERKKDRKRQLKQQQEQERLAKEIQRQAEEAKKLAQQQEKLNAERQKRERERQKKMEERRIKDEERRHKEEEKRRRLKVEKERRQKEQEERDRQEKEFLKEKALKEKELKDELARRECKLKQQIILHNRQVIERAPLSELVTNKKLDDPVSLPVPLSQSTPVPATLSSLSASVSVSQPDTSSLSSIFQPTKAIQITSNTPKQQLSTDILTNVAPHPHLAPSSDLSQPNLFPLPPQPFLDTIQASHPLFGPPPLDNTISPLPPLQQYHQQQQPISSTIGVPPSALGVGYNGPSNSPFHPAMEPSLSSHGRSPLRCLGQLQISNSSPSSTITTPSPSTSSPDTVTSSSIFVPPNHARRSSAAAGPIGSPVTHRFHGLMSGSDSGSQEMDGALGTGSHRTSSNADGSPDYSFFSNFLFGESNKGTASTTATPSLPFIDTDQLKLDKCLHRERRFSMDSPNQEWKNGWSATSMLAENIHGNLFGDALIERRLMLLDRAKVAYRKLDEITQTNSFVGRTRSSHTLVQLHRMMNDLYCDTQVDLAEFDDILNHSPQVEFQCIHHAQHGLLVSYDPGSTLAANATPASMAATPTTHNANDSLILRRSSVLPYNTISPTSSFPSYNLPSCHNSPFSYNTNIIYSNPPPSSQQQYCPVPPTTTLSPELLSPSPFTYSPTPFSHTGQIDETR